MKADNKDEEGKRLIFGALLPICLSYFLIFIVETLRSPCFYAVGKGFFRW